MADPSHDEELRDLGKRCARIYEELDAVRRRIEQLEAAGDATTERPPAPPPAWSSPSVPPATPYATPSVPPAGRKPPSASGPHKPSRDETSEEDDEYLVPDIVESDSATFGIKDVAEMVRKLMRPSAESPGDAGPGDAVGADGSTQSTPVGSAGGMELRIGGTWLNRAGAIILFLAVAFFAKYSFDQGWISPAMRVVAAAAVGLIMLGVGEYYLARAARTFASGLLGAGVCVLYLAVYGAHGFYGLIDAREAFVLYLIVTALSVVLSVHGRLLAVAVLGVIGGFATPVVLSTGGNQQVALLVYVLALDIGFLVSGSIRRWDVLRVLCWLGTVVLFGAWYVKFYETGAMWTTAGFVLTFYLLFHTEAIVCLRRGATEWPGMIAHVVHADNAAFFASTYFLLREAVPQWMGLFAVVAAGLQWLAAWRLCGRRELAESARLAFWLGGAAMLALAAPLQFDRYMVSVSWAVQAVVTLWFCRSVDRVWLRVKGSLILIAAAGHLLVYDYRDIALTQAFWTVGHWHLSWLIVCFVFVAMCGYGGAAVLSVRRDAPDADRALSGLLAVLGTAMLLGIFADQWERYVATWWWLGLGVIWFVLAIRVPAARAMAAGLCAAVLIKFFAWDTGEAIARGHWESIHGIVLNRAVVTGVVVAAFCRIIRPMAERLPDEYRSSMNFEPAPVLTVAALLAVTWTGTFEILRVFRFEPLIAAHFEHPLHAQGVFITAYWALNACVLWRFSVPRSPVLSGYGLILTWFTILKFSGLDTLTAAGSGHWGELEGIGTNRTFLVGLLVIGLGLLAYRRCRHLAQALRTTLFSPEALTGLLVLVAVLITWVPTFEICRIYHFEPFRLRFTDPQLAMHATLSVFWSLSAMALLILGFLRRVAPLRYLALGLFAVTIVKVFLFDLARLEMIYRIVSFMVLGVLLLFASWLYQRLSSRLDVATTDAVSGSPSSE